MNKYVYLGVLWLSLLMLVLPTASAGISVGQEAPDFTANDSSGVPRTLSDYKGKYVVLEWINHDCPFVKKHYGSGNMQKLQKKYTVSGLKKQGDYVCSCVFELESF